mgnify:CR=1 FL=1
MIILDNFISNIIDINKTLLILKSLLSKNGKILIYTNYSSFNILRNDINCFYHEHVHYFSLKSLLILFKKNGLYLGKFKFLEDITLITFVSDLKSDIYSRLF